MSTLVMNNSKKYNLVRFDDKLIYNGSYHLTARAVKVLCFVIAKYVDPLVEVLPNEIHVPLKEIEQAIKQNEQARWKSLYTDIDSICDELTSKIQFKTNVEVQGIKLKGYINWCSSAIPYRDQNGHVFVRLGFDSLMTQFLVGLVNYVRIYRPELNRLRRGHAIRLFQMLKGIRNKRQKYEQVSVERYDLEHFKFLFGLANKYPRFNNFRARVLDASVEEINSKTSVHILDIKYIRNSRRKVVTLEFRFTDQDTPNQKNKTKLLELSNFEPAEKDLQTLSWAKRQAYDKLIELGITPGIAYRQLLPTIKGSEFKGYEDYFVEYAIKHFKTWAKQQKSKEMGAATFVNWWLKLKVFDTSSDVWSKMLEQVNNFKKKLRQQDQVRADNREKAATMTELEFKQWYQVQKENKQTNALG